MNTLHPAKRKTTTHGIRLIISLILVFATIGIWPTPMLSKAQANDQFFTEINTTANATLIGGTVTIWHAYQPGSADETALKQIIQNAKTANPGLIIISSYHSFDTLYSDYEAAVLSGGGPDMYIAPNDNLGNEARSGLILNINSYLQGKLSNVRQAAIDAMKVDGQLYGVPESAKAVALYYNKSQIATPPATTAQLLSLVQSGKKVASEGAVYFLYGLWHAFGGQLMDVNGRCTADQGGFVPAMQYILQLQNAGALLNTDYEQAHSKFVNGQVSMWINGPWALADLQEAMGSNLGVAVLPAGPSGIAKPLGGPDGFYINPNTTNLTNTINLALYMTNQASSQIFTNVGKHVPVRTDVVSSDPLINTFAQAFAQGEPRPQTPEFNNYWAPFSDLFNRVLNGIETSQVGVQRACNKMNVLNGFTPTTNTVTLWYAYVQGSGEENALLQVVDNALAADNTLTIVAIPQPFGSIYDDYNAAVLSGGGPDMYIAPNDNLGDQARSGVILNINSYLQGKLGKVSQAAIDGMKVAGQLYGVPESAKVVALYYNKSQIATPPTNTAQLLSLVQSGKSLVTDGASYYLYGFWNAFGGQLMDASGRCIADQGGFVPAMQYFLDLQNAGALLNIDYSEAYSKFVNGEVSMLINGPWVLADLEAAMGGNLGVVVLPAGPSGIAKPLGGPDGFYINPNTTNLTNAINLALYMTNQASSQVFTTVGGHVPVRSDVTSTDPLINKFAQAFAQGEPRPQSPQFGNYWSPFSDLFANVLSGTETPQVGVQRACNTMNTLNEFLVTITGNATVDGVTFSYVNETPKTTLSDATGNYSITVPYHWTGTLTPTHSCFAFDPANRPYSNIPANQIAQNFTPIVKQGCADIVVSAGVATRGEYGLLNHTSKRASYSSVNSGPAKLTSKTAITIVGSQRVIYGGVSYSEMIGLPLEQLSKEYWFPYYNNVAMNSQLRVSNLGNVPTTIKVYLGGNQIDSYTLAAGSARRWNYAAQNGGPLKVTSSDTNILATIRVLYGSSYSEMMGLPKEQLTKEYLFPYYNNVAMNSQLRVSNVGGGNTIINVYLGSNPTPIDSYSLAAGGATRKNYAGQNSGPLRVTSSASNILTTIRVLYGGSSYSELMGYPSDQLAQEYWYPVYDNSSLDSQLRVSNVGTGPTTITVYAGNTQIDSYSLAKGAATRRNYVQNTGPLHVVSSTEPILSTIRMLYLTPSYSSYYEMTGLPDTQLSTQYFFPWYNNVAMSSELRFAVP